MAVNEDAARQVAAMRASPNHPITLVKACRALRDMAGFPAGQASVAGAGAIEAIVAAQARHLQHPPLQSAACGALHWITNRGNAATCARAVAAGAIATVAAALCNHPDHTNLQGNARKMLENVAAARVAASGGMDALVAALQARAATAARPVAPAQAASLLAAIAPAWADAPPCVCACSCFLAPS